METSTEKELLFKVLDDMGEVKNKIHSIDITLIEQNADLKAHMKRTELAEMTLEILKKDIKPALDVYKNIGIVSKLIVKIVAFVSPIIYCYFKYIKD